MLNQNGRSSLQESAENAKRRGYFLINTAYFAFWIVIAVLVIRYLFAWMIPFVFGFVVAALLQKPLKWLVKKTRISRKIFSVAMVVLVVLLLAGIVSVLGWGLIAWLIDFFDAENIAVMQKALTDLINSLQSAIGNLALALPDSFTNTFGDSLSSLPGKLIELLTSLLSGVASWVVSLTTSFPNLLINFFMWILSSIFLTIDYDAVTGFLKRQVPARYTPMMGAVKEFFGTALFGYARTYSLLILITFVELCIGFLILQVPHAIPLALLVALIDIMPILGTGTVLIPWSIISLILGDFRMAIGIGILYIVITVIRNIIEPKLVSVQIGLHPVVTLFFMLLGLRAIGILGMFIFPVTVLILKQLHDAGYIRLWK